MGYNYFELDIPTFLGMHLVFNVELLLAIHPLLLDTSDIVENLSPMELNPDCMKQGITDQIIDT